jgi:hypothetical protein
MRLITPAIAATLLAGILSGCGGDDQLTGTPKDLPPGYMPPAPPLTQSPKDLAGMKKSKPARPAAAKQ